MKHDAYNVLLCVIDPILADDILKLNGGQKIRLLQTPRALQWGDHEILKYFGSNPRNEAGTPGYCVDTLRGILINHEEKAQAIDKEWIAGDFLAQHL